MRDRRSIFSAQTAGGSLRAFTLVEMIVVIVILGVLAGVTTVRMSNTLPRRGGVAVSRVQSVLDSLAHRHVSSQSPAALEYDASLSELWLERFDFADDLGSVPGTLPPRGAWRRDLLCPVIHFERDVFLRAAYVNGQQERGSFRVEIAPDAIRPSIEIEIQYGDVVEVVSLLPSEMRSMTLSDESRMLRLSPEDLHATGSGDEKW